ncbi:TPA: hypothetical protein ACXI7C_000458 [Serratia marcescens]
MTTIEMIKNLAQRNSVVASSDVMAVFAELEAKAMECRGIEQERELFRIERTAHQQHAQELEKRVAELSELETQVKVWESAATKHLARAEEAEKRLATPVRLLGEMLPHEWERAERQATFEHRKIAWDARLAEDKKAILAAGFTFTVEGDE